ncbi:MAG: hypothetical protein RIC55_10335 [Pirellulaceae bacterium]
MRESSSLPIEQNPYAEQSTQTDVADDGGGRAAPAQITEPLRRSRLWMYLLSLLGLAAAALVLLMLVGGLMFMMRLSGVQGIRRDILPFLVVNLVYGSLAAALAIPSVLLWRFALRIGWFLRRPTSQRLEALLASQARFWRWSGGIVLGLVTIYILMIAFSIAMTWTDRW